MNTPQNAGYLIAAYSVASVLLVAYAVSLFRRYRSGR
jgi:CcmD family protein